MTISYERKCGSIFKFLPKMKGNIQVCQVKISGVRYPIPFEYLDSDWIYCPQWYSKKDQNKHITSAYLLLNGHKHKAKMYKHLAACGLI